MPWESKDVQGLGLKLLKWVFGDPKRIFLYGQDMFFGLKGYVNRRMRNHRCDEYLELG